MKKKHIGIIGNPNCGKSSLFNLLTGLSQKVGNFTGVTVEKKTGTFKNSGEKIQLIDFPGTYSLYPNSLDERIVVETLLNTSSPDCPDAIIYVSDISKIEKQTLLLTQLRDMGFPIIWVLNMADTEEKGGFSVNRQKLEETFGVPVLKVSTKTKQGIDKLNTFLEKPSNWKKPVGSSFYKLTTQEKEITSKLLEETNIEDEYKALLTTHHYNWLPSLADKTKNKVAALREKFKFKELNAQVEETMSRYNSFNPNLKKAISRTSNSDNNLTQKLDRILTHQVGGFIIFFVVMILIFQMIFSWASYPMDLIDAFFGNASSFFTSILPEAWYTDLLTNGIIPGVGGVLIFIPQIAILFFMIGLLEEVGYMSRVSFLWDRIMQFFGLNGRSTVALISSGACAVPAIMSARTISNRKERLLTILVSPFISCSARIPVYTLLIAFVVPPMTVLGFFNLQGIAFMGLYLLGILAAGVVSLILKYLIKSNEPGFLALELPNYRRPLFRNVLLSTWSKVYAFIKEAGKVILMISILLWFAASYGPGNAMEKAEMEAQTVGLEKQLSDQELDNLIAANQLEASYAGRFGQFIEPAIRPLGYDWKIGIALLTSFAAREVFVGTMATIYNLGNSDDELKIRDRMALEFNPQTNKPVYTLATSLSLLIFYVFALQCMSTLVVIKKETGGWKWPIVLFFISFGIAYFGALFCYQYFQ